MYTAIDNQTFNKQHWLFALIFALLIHLLFFVNYRVSITDNGAEAQGRDGIEIGLKKLALPAIEKKISRPPQQVPVKPKPLPKPAPVVQTEIKPLEVEELIDDALMDSVMEEEVVGSSESIAGGGNQELEIVYTGELLAWLERHKRYPAAARRRQMQATILLEFAITAEGRLIHFRLLEPSRFTMLNKAVETMVQKANPFPPLPPKLRLGKAEYVYQVPVEFILSR